MIEGAGIVMIVGIAGTVGTVATVGTTVAPMIGGAETGTARPKRLHLKTTSKRSSATSSATSGRAGVRIAEAAAGVATGIGRPANPLLRLVIQAESAPLGPISSRSCFE